MKKITYIFALLALAACSNDDVVNTTSTNEIGVAVTAVTSSRAQTALELHQANQVTNMQSFKLWAAVSRSGKFVPFFEGEQVNYSSTTSKWALSTPRYWPQDDALNFWAYHNNSATPGSAAFSGTTLMVTDIEVPQASTDQDDALYAEVTDEARDSHNGVVPINFRHALALLNFRIQNEVGSLVAEVQKFELCNLLRKDSFTISGATDAQYTTDGTNAYACNLTYTTDSHDGATGTEWCYTTDDGANSYVLCKPDGDIVAPTQSQLMVLPLKFDCGVTGNNWRGVYLKLTCRLYSIVDLDDYATKTEDKTDAEIHEYLTASTDASGAAVATKGVQIFPKTKGEFATLWIPVHKFVGADTYDTCYSYGWDPNGDLPEAGEENYPGWEAGKKYVYTITFSKNGGDVYDSDGNPQLVKINVSYTVDDWAEDLGDHDGEGT